MRVGMAVCIFLVKFLGLAAAGSSIGHHQNSSFAGRLLQSSEGAGELETIC